jgi:hypothetical protein
MPAPTYRSVRLEPWLCSACIDPFELMVDHQGLIATIGIEFIAKKGSRENCANRVVSPRGSEVIAITELCQTGSWVATRTPRAPSDANRVSSRLARTSR